MTRDFSFLSRRGFLGGLALGAAAFTVPGVFAEELSRTPWVEEGPFYPDKLPLDTDNDLLLVNSSITPAVGTITHLSGRLLDAKGEPLRNAIIEIWQCDNSGIYIHSNGGDRTTLDKNFQGFGRFVTGRSGEYAFRTIKPVPYPGRTPHIHFAIKYKGQQTFTTQAFIKGHPQNTQDGIFNGLNAKARDMVALSFDPIKESKIGEVAARFDIVMGYTPPL